MSGFGVTLDLILIATPLAALVVLWLLWLGRARIDALLREPRRLWIVAAVAAGVVVAAGSPLMLTSLRLARERSAIIDVLSSTSLRQKNPATVELLEKGSVTVGDATYRAPNDVAKVVEELFDQSTGKLVYAPQLADVFMAPVMPTWAPPMMFETGMVAAIVGAGAALAFGAVLLGLGPTLLAVLVAAVGASALATLNARVDMLVAIAGMVILITGYGVLSRLILRALSRPEPTMAVANVVVRESTRRWYTGAFIVVLLVVLPLVPLAIDAGPLRYRIQAFLSWSLGVTFSLAGLMTLVLSCATVALEIRDRQIWQTLTKPVARLRYIVGKWLGVVLVNAILLAVSGASILLFVEYMRTQRAQDFMDEFAVRDEILVARVGTTPDYAVPTSEQLSAAVDQAINADSTLRTEIESKARDVTEVRRSLAAQEFKDFLSEQRVIPPGQSRTFVFRGLERAKALEANLTLNYLLHIGASDSHEKNPIAFRFKDGTWFDKEYVAAHKQSQIIPWQYVDDDGTLTLELGNYGLRDGEFRAGNGSINWDADGLEVLVKVGGFEPNFVRAMLIEWVKLSVLAMLGVCCATVLSFPVALLFSGTVYLIGSITPFMALAIENYTIDEKSMFLVQGFQYFVRGIAQVSYWALSGFGRVSGESLLVEGRLVPWREVGRAYLMLGLGWTGGAAILGWFLFQRKEIAIYSGHGG